MTQLKMTYFDFFPKSNGQLIFKTALITGREHDRTVRNQHNDSHVFQQKCLGTAWCM
jgi:hypothetical protein